jgi:hypothetical protein
MRCACQKNPQILHFGIDEKKNREYNSKSVVDYDIVAQEGREKNGNQSR